MTTRQYSSRSQQTTLTGAITAGATSMTVVSGTALLGGVTIPAGRTFTLVIDPDTALEEIVDATAVSTNTFTVTRGIDGSTGQEHSAGAVVRHMAIGRDFRDANLHIEATTAYNDGSGNSHTLHGLGSGDGELVGTSKPQTLTAKTLTTPNIAGATISGAFTSTATITGGTVNATTLQQSGVQALTTSGSQTVSNKTIALGSNTVSGTLAEFNTALTDGDFATLNGTETLTNKTLTSPTITGTGSIAGTFTGNLTGNVTGNASTATALETARGFQIVGDVEAGSVSFDGTGDVTLSTQIATGAIVNADVNASAGIAYSKLSLNGSITSADIADGTILNADIASTAAIALSKLAVDPLARANHTGTQLASTISDFDTQVRTSKVTDLTAPTSSFSMNSQKITNLADPTSPQDAVTVNYIDGQKGAASGIASLDAGGKIPSAQLPAIAVTDTFVVASQAAMLALSAQVGDIAVRTDVNKSFILKTADPTVLANWQELLTPTDLVLSVDGQTGAVDLSGTYVAKAGDTMAGALNMGTNKVTNLGTPTDNADAATKLYVDNVAGTVAEAEAAAAAAIAAYDAFDDRYLGSKSTPPTLDNDGNPLLTGAMYWNSVNSTMYTYSGTAWIAISTTASLTRYKFVATGGETSLSGPDANGLTLAYTPGKEQLYLNGVLLVRVTDYTASNGTSITSLAALSAGDIVEIIVFTPFESANAINSSLFTAKGDILIATAAGTPGKLGVATDGWYLKADSSTVTGLTWAPNELLPDQTGNSGKYLTTDGSSASWAVIDLSSQANVIMTIMGAY